jgi:formylglycine-generating enzyme required for sulfatase activity
MKTKPIILAAGALSLLVLLFSTGAQSATPQKSCIEESADQIWLPGGSFPMGSDRAYPSERPMREVRVDGFWIDAHEVTNRQFAKFVDETKYVTLAERTPEPIPNAPPEMLKPGSGVFVQPERVTSQDIRQWWRYTPGADWRHPEGPKTTIEGRENYPVVHIAFEDAVAYAKWAGRELPTEAQWEYAARAGSKTMFPWGDQLAPGGQHMANTWTGTFPVKNTVDDGYPRAAPVGCFEASKFGLHDMIGNVWEWTIDWYAPGHNRDDRENPKGPPEEKSVDRQKSGFPVKVIKGGSYLCAPNFCARFRPAAREAQDTGLGTNHIGFRTVSNTPAP